MTSEVSSCTKLQIFRGFPETTERVKYKLVSMVHNCLHQKAPQYLTDCCIPISDVASRWHLRSASRHHLVVPRHNLSTYGRRAFAVAGPAAWNSLSDDLRDPALSNDTVSDTMSAQDSFVFWVLVHSNTKYALYTYLRPTYSVLTYLFMRYGRKVSASQWLRRWNTEASTLSRLWAIAQR